MIRCLLETSITTSSISYPFARGWLDAPDWLDLQERVTADMIGEQRACALVDAIDATRLFETHAVLSDLALVSTHNGPIALHSERRPDEIENAVVQLGTVGPVAEAAARATIHHFYGIDVLDWSRAADHGDIEVVQDTEVFTEAGDIFREDLVRAWFILTSLSLPSHVFVAPLDVLQDQPELIQPIMNELRRATNVSDERRRELRRNLSDDHDLDRDRLTQFLNDQKTRLTKSGRKGWLDLANRVAKAMQLPDELRPVMHSLASGRE